MPPCRSGSTPRASSIINQMPIHAAIGGVVQSAARNPVGRVDTFTQSKGKASAVRARSVEGISSLLAAQQSISPRGSLKGGKPKSAAARLPSPGSVRTPMGITSIAMDTIKSNASQAMGNEVAKLRPDKDSDKIANFSWTHVQAHPRASEGSPPAVDVTGEITKVQQSNMHGDAADKVAPHCALLALEGAHRSLGGNQLGGRVLMIEREARRTIKDATTQSTTAVEKLREEVRTELSKCHLQFAMVQNELAGAAVQLGKLTEEITSLRAGTEKPSIQQDVGTDHADAAPVENAGASFMQESLARLLKRVDIEQQLRELAIAQEANARRDSHEHLLARLQSLERGSEHSFSKHELTCEQQLATLASADLEALRASVLVDLKTDNEELHKALLIHVNATMEAHIKHVGHALDVNEKLLHTELDAMKTFCIDRLGVAADSCREMRHAMRLESESRAQEGRKPQSTEFAPVVVPKQVSPAVRAERTRPLQPAASGDL